MRAYVTVVDGEDQILEHWARYFVQDMKVTEFFLTTFGTIDEQSRAFETLEKYGSVLKGKLFQSQQFNMWRRERYVCGVHNETANGSWAFFCDLDEFPYMPEGVEHYLKKAESNDCPFVIGRWVDRFALRGELNPIDSRPLEEQFPLAMRMKSNLAKLKNRGDSVFVLSRTGLRSHHPQGHAFMPYREKAPQIDVHHFRWHAELATRLRRRKEVRQQLNGYQNQILSEIEADSRLHVRAAIHVNSLLGC